MSRPEFIDDAGDDDAALEPLLSPLKNIEPSPQARRRFRAAVAAELDRRSPTAATVPWWRRRISVPVPAAVCLTLLMLGYVGWTARLLAVPAQHVAQSPNDSQGSTAKGREMLPTRETEEPPPEPTLPELEYHFTQTYLCGIGRVKSESGYSFRE